MVSSNSKLWEFGRCWTEEQLRASLNERRTKPQLFDFHYKSNTLVGVEIEIENCGPIWEPDVEQHAAKLELVDPYWKVVEDGSLRNRGAEFVSRLGMNISEVLSGIHSLANYLMSTTQSEFNYRTGVHVHISCNDRTINEIKSIFLLYALFEDTIFKISGDRQNNKFCCPIRKSKTDISRILLEDNPNEYFASGQKYLAFNYRPLWEYGTIEFRHHYGTIEFEQLEYWIKTLDYLYKYACSKPYAEIKEAIFALNNISNYKEFCRDVFKDLYNTFDESIVQDMREGCLFIKECYIDVESITPDVETKPLKKKVPEVDGFDIGAFYDGAGQVPRPARQLTFAINDVAANVPRAQLRNADPAALQDRAAAILENEERVRIQIEAGQAEMRNEVNRNRRT